MLFVKSASIQTKNETYGDKYDIKLYNVNSTNMELFDENGVSVVTVFIDLGNFVKGGPLRLKSEYFEWAENFAKIKNHVICFTDDRKFYRKFQSVRRGLPTTLSLVKKSELHTYGNVPALRRIFAQDNYPSYEPDTKNAEYVAVMNGKYDFIATAMKMFPNVDHVMWLDLGLFRFYPYYAPCFRLIPPANFDDSKIAYTRVDEFRTNLTAKFIVFNHLVWVCGCAFYGTRETMTKFIDQFRSAVDRLISMKTVSSDQQTLYSLYSDPTLADLRNVTVQTYRISGNLPYDNDEWFHLGYRMRVEEKCGIKKTISRTRTTEIMINKKTKFQKSPSTIPPYAYLSSKNLSSSLSSLKNRSKSLNIKKIIENTTSLQSGFVPYNAEIDQWINV